MNYLYYILRPIFMRMDPEKAHSFVIESLKFCERLGITPFASEPDDPVLNCRIWSRSLENPIGLSAGLDKNAEIIRSLLEIGFGFVEVGAITPLPQKGTKPPRLFRLTEDKALINRFGFPNDGLATISGRLTDYAKSARIRRGIVGANIGFNDQTDDALNDYVRCATELFGLVDYVTLNVSCPNTPGVRNFQKEANLRGLLSAIKQARLESGTTAAQSTPILIKISSDLEDEDLEGVAKAAIEMAVDGIIVGNTITTRPKSIKSEYSDEIGGLSGRPLFRISTETLQEIYRLTKGEIPLIGVGGVSSGQDAYEKIRAGASFVQFYTALVYEGPGLVKRIKHELAELLKRDGYRHVYEAVGADVDLSHDKVPQRVIA